MEVSAVLIVVTGQYQIRAPFTLINKILFYENDSMLKLRVTPRVHSNNIIILSF